MLSAKLPAFSGGQSTIVFATTNGTGKVADADTKAAIETALTKLRAVPHVASVVDPFQGRLVSQSSTVALGQVQWSAKAAEVKDANLTAVKEAMKRYRPTACRSNTTAASIRVGASRCPSCPSWSG